MLSNINILEYSSWTYFSSSFSRMVSPATVVSISAAPIVGVVISFIASWVVVPASAALVFVGIISSSGLVPSFRRVLPSWWVFSISIVSTVVIAVMWAVVMISVSWIPSWSVWRGASASLSSWRWQNRRRPLIRFRSWFSLHCCWMFLLFRSRYVLITFILFSILICDLDLQFSIIIFVPIIIQRLFGTFFIFEYYKSKTLIHSSFPVQGYSDFLYGSTTVKEVL